jgi:hypothetical protein
MTNDQWKIFEDSMANAPGITMEMFNARVKEMTQAEVVDMSRCLLSVTRCIESLAAGRITEKRDVEDLADLTMSMMSGMYGRLMGLARAYDTLITKQVMLEAELASTGK